MGKLTAIFMLLFVSSPSYAADCAELASEYGRYDSDRVRAEVSGIQDDSAIRDQNRLALIMIIFQRQSMVLNLMIAQGCDLPDPPREFIPRGIMCRGSPQACR